MTDYGHYTDLTLSTNVCYGQIVQIIEICAQEKVVEP